MLGFWYIEDFNNIFFKGFVFNSLSLYKKKLNHKKNEIEVSENPVQ